MTGDLLMDSSNNDSVSIGCTDFGAGEKSFGVYLGNVQLFITAYYTTP